MIEFKLELPREMPPESRAELVRELGTSARVETGEAVSKNIDAAQTLFVLAAAVQTIDIIWKWYQSARAKDKRWDVMVTMPDGLQVHLKDVTLQELKKLIGQGD